MKKLTPLIIGNWKMNPMSRIEAELLTGAVVKGTKKMTADIVIAPPFLFIEAVQKKLLKSAVSLGAQNLFAQPVGAFTGEVSGAQLRVAGVTAVIIGHSERRARGESNTDVQEKVLAALKNKLTPVVCIGEVARDEQGGHFTAVEAQLRSLSEILSSTQLKQTVLAYEPIWAIGTGKTATAEDVKEMQLFIVSTLSKLYDRTTAQKVRLIYGGSVKPVNAAELHAQGGMSGFLVGGASLKAEEFCEIVKQVQ